VPVPLPLTVEISDELEPEHADAVIKAADAWNEAVPGIVKATKTVDRPSHDEGTAFVHYAEFSEDAAAKTILYNCWGKVQLHRSYSDVSTLDEYIEHEFGHVFGLEHSDDSTSVMYGDGFVGPVEIQEADATAASGAMEAHHDLHKRCANAAPIRD